MYTQDRVLELVDLIYAAACDPAGWSSVLEALCRITGATGADIAAFDLEAPVARFHTAVGLVGSQFQQEYPRFLAIDPYVEAARKRGLFRAGMIGLGEPAVPFRKLCRTAFYNDFAKRFDYVGGLSAVISASAHGGSAVSLCRPPNVLFGDAELALMCTLLPHFRRALQVHDRLSESAVRASAFEETLDRLTTGAVLVDPESIVLFANKAARSILNERDGLIEDRGRLWTPRAAGADALRNLIGGAARTSTANGFSSGGLLVLNRPSGRRPLQLLVSPLSRAAEAQGTASAVIFIIDPARPVRAVDMRTREAHGFSRAESAVAALLLQDKTVREISDVLCVSANTVRFHLKQMLGKTNTRRQGELVRLLIIGTAVRS